MVVVFDCNVLVSAFISRGSTPDKCLSKSRGGHTILFSQQTFDEFNSIFLRPKFDRYLTVESRLELILELQNSIKLVKISCIISVCRDPKDNMYLELALSGKANCIVTGDPDLLVLHPFRNISILSPKDFLEKF